MNLVFRRLVPPGLLSTFREWPGWLRQLKGKSGVYIIRDGITGAAFYVGESHTGHLSRTVTRHFQSWHGKTAGPTYSRYLVEVATVTTAPAAAVAAQDKLISRLDPRDNRQSRPEPDNPF